MALIYSYSLSLFTFFLFLLAYRAFSYLCDFSVSLPTRGSFLSLRVCFLFPFPSGWVTYSFPFV